MILLDLLDGTPGLPSVADTFVSCIDLAQTLWRIGTAATERRKCGRCNRLRRRPHCDMSQLCDKDEQKPVAQRNISFLHCNIRVPAGSVSNGRR
jgi:hypothetical protein